MLGAVPGARTGLHAILAACPRIVPALARALALSAGLPGLTAATTVTRTRGGDDSHDVFGVRCTGAILGALLTAVACVPSRARTGVHERAANASAEHSIAGSCGWRLWALVCRRARSGVAAALRLKIAGLQVAEDPEHDGLETVWHRARADD